MKTNPLFKLLMSSKPGPYLLLLSVFCVFECCTKVLDIEFEDTPSVLVVDGFISNENNIYTVKLSRAAAFTGVRDLGGNPSPIDNASVTVSDDQGTVFEFLNTRLGTYESDSLVFRGEVGRVYTLEIVVDGQTYRSTPEILSANATFDVLELIETSQEVLSSFSGRLVARNGVELLVDFTMQDKPDSYVRWVVSYIIDKQLILKESIQLVSRSELTNDNLLQMPVDFVFDIAEYDASVEMHSLSPKAYDFWVLGKKQQENGGTIFESAPIEIPGNIVNVNNPDELVLGLFTAGSISRKEASFSIN